MTDEPMRYSAPPHIGECTWCYRTSHLTRTEHGDLCDGACMDSYLKDSAEQRTRQLIRQDNQRFLAFAQSFSRYAPTADRGRPSPQESMIINAITVLVPKYLHQLQAASPTDRADLVTQWSTEKIAAPPDAYRDEGHDGMWPPSEWLAVYSDSFMGDPKFGSKSEARTRRRGLHIAAKAIAALATAPGGIRFSDRHWCLEHNEQCQARWYPEEAAA